MSETLRIAFLSSDHPRQTARGAGHIISEVSRRMAHAGHDVDVYYPVRSRGLPSVQDFDGVRGIPVGCLNSAHLPFGSDLEYAWRVAKVLPADREVIVAHNESGGVFVTRQSRRARAHGSAVTVQTFHGIALRFLQIARDRRPKRLRAQLGYYPDWLVVRALEGGAARNADACIVCSRAIGAEVTQLYRVPRPRIRVIYNGVETQPAPTLAERAEARRFAGVPEGAMAVSFLGEDTHRKGLDVATRTVELLRRRGRPAVLLNMGNFAASTDAVRSFGFVDDATKRRLLVASDVFLLPTRYEGLPAVVQEAASLRVPVVTTRAANIEWGTPGQDFLLLEPNTPEMAAEVLEGLATSEERRRSLAEGGYRELGSRGYEQQTDEYLALFRELLAGTGR